MTLTLHHRLALIGATATSAIALGDAMTHGLTGEAMIAEAGDAWGSAASSVAHGLTYAALGAVLVAERRRIDAVNRGARVARRLLLGSFGTLTVVFLVLPFQGLLRDWGVLGVVETAAGLGFGGMFLGGVALGVALGRREEHLLEARLLVGVVGALGLVLLLAWLAPDFAHPAYMETLLHFGIATTGAGFHVGARRRTPDAVRTFSSTSRPH